MALREHFPPSGVQWHQFFLCIIFPFLSRGKIERKTGIIQSPPSRDMGHNLFTGTLPTEWGAWTQMQAL